MKSGVYSFGQSCYNDPEFAFAREKDNDRIDVDFVTKARSKAEALRKITAVHPVDRMGSTNWVRERLGTTGNDKQISRVVDDAVYVFADKGKLLLGKFIGTTWIRNPNYKKELQQFKQLLNEKDRQRATAKLLAEKAEDIARKLSIASPIVTCPHCQNKIDLAIVYGGASPMKVHGVTEYYTFYAFKPRKEE